jgi:hypothetical protein
MPSSDASQVVNRTLVLWDAQYSYVGRIATRPTKVKFTFFVNQRLSSYKKDSSFILSAGDNVVQQGTAVFEEQTFAGEKEPYTREVLRVEIPTEAFLNVVHAKKVQIKFGPETYKLSSNQRNHIRALAATIDHLSK